MFSTIDEGIISLKQKALSNLHLKTEIQLTGTLAHIKEKSFVINSEVSFWLAEEKKIPKVLLLQGTAGSGKTQFCQNLEKQLWSKYDDYKVIPLYISLASLKNPISYAIEESLENIGFNQRQIAVLKKEYNFVFILDGYDELYEFRNLHFSNKLSEWHAKTIITCRSEALYFINDYEKYFVPFYRNRRLTIGLQQITINSLSSIQIEEFVTSYVKEDSSVISYPELTMVPGLLPLIETPLLLKAILSTPKHSFSQFKDFYNKVIETRFLWQEQKLKAYDLIDKQADFKVYFWEYCTSLARVMLEHQTNTIAYSQTNPSLFDSSVEESIWWKFFNKDHKIQLIYSGCPLKKSTLNYVKFMDDCLIDYFATYINPHKEQDMFPRSMPVERDETLAQEIEFTRIVIPIIARKLFTKEEIKVQQLADRIVESESFKKSLFNYIELSKTDKHFAIAAANAITGLNNAKISFSGMDFKGISIPEADLSQAILDYTNLEGSDLSSVKLKTAWLRGASLKRSNMDGVYFGELAYISSPNKVNCSVYSPNQQYFAVASNNEIKIYKVNTLTNSLKLDQTFTVLATPDSVNNINPDSDNLWLASGNDENINRIQNRSTQSQTIVVPIPTVYSIIFSSNAQWLASGNSDNTVRVWNLADSTSNKLLTDHTDSVYSVAFSRNNQWLASGSADNTVRLWDLVNPANNQILIGHTHSIYSVAFSYNNQWLASGSSDNTIRIWDLIDFANKQTLTGHTNWVRSVAFSPDNQWLASGSIDKTVRLWSLVDSSSNQILTCHTRPVCSVTFSSDNQWLASGSYDNTVRLWNLKDCSNNQTLAGHTDIVLSVIFSPNNQWLASGSYDNTVRFWNLMDLLSRKNLTVHAHWTLSVAFSPDNQWIASGSSDNMIHLWNLTNTTINRTLVGHTHSVYSVAFSSDNQWLASGNYDSTGQSDNAVRLWNLIDSRNNKMLIGHTSWVLSVAFSPNNQWLASGGADNTIRLWNLVDLTHNQTLTGHTKWVRSVTFSSDNQWLASGGYDNTVHLWNLVKPSKNQTLTDHTSLVVSVAFSHNTEWLASGSYDKTIRIWNLIDPICNQTLTGHTKPVISVAFSHNNQWLASGGHDHFIYIWALAGTNLTNYTWNKILNVQTGISTYSLTYSFVSNHVLLASGGSDDSVRLWEQQYDKLHLIWTSCQTVLCADQTDITSTQLSINNFELLKQRGAIGEPIIKDELASLSSETNPLLFSNPYLLPSNAASSDSNINQSLATDFATKCRLTS